MTRKPNEIEEQTKKEYIKKPVSFQKTSDLLHFDIKDNIQRIYNISKADNAFYFLSMLSFIEGYFRDRYRDHPKFNNIDYDSCGGPTRSEIINKVISLEKPDEDVKKTLHLILSFMQTSNDGKSFRNQENKWIETKKATIFFISGDRIRHSFSKQDKRNTILLVQKFIHFAQFFNFYEDNKEILDKLLDDNEYFSEMKTRTPENDTDQLAEIGMALIELRNKGSSEERQEAEEVLNEYQLQQALYAQSWRDYQSMMSSLTEEQKQISEEILGHIQNNKKITRLIKGGPGTGKTLILINLLQKTLDKNIKLLTYTNSLTKYNKYLANLVSFNGVKLSQKDKENLSNRINCFDDFFISIAQKITKKKIVHLQDINLPAIQKCARHYNMSTENLEHEAKEIWLNLPGMSKFIDFTYAQKTPASAEEQEIRKVYWEAVEHLEKFFDLEDILPTELFFYKVQKNAILIPENLKLDYLLIDEIQDLEAAKIEAIQHICKKGFILTGDKTQSIFVRKGLPWVWLNKKKFQVPEQQLTKNFRSTIPIQKLANRYRKEISLKDKDTISEGFMPGPEPEAYVSKSTETIYSKIQERIVLLKENLYFNNKDFCIVAANEGILTSIQNKLKDVLIETISIEDESFSFDDSVDKIKLSRTKYIKGIDLPVIILILDKSFINKELNDNLDIFGQENSIYTCISRAMNMLNIFFIDDEDLLQKPNSVHKLYNLMKKSVIHLDN